MIKPVPLIVVSTEDVVSLIVFAAVLPVFSVDDNVSVDTVVTPLAVAVAAQ